MADLMSQRSITYQNDLQHSYMVVKLEQADEVIDYQVRMMQDNPVSQLLPLHKKQLDMDICLFYDVTSKITLNQLLKRVKLSKHEFLSMLKSLISALRLGDAYLLQGGGFVLHSDYIYVDPATFEFSLTYLPIAVDHDINEVLKSWLMDLLIYKVSFETADQGDFVYELLNQLKSGSFSLNQLDKAIGSLALRQKPISMDAAEVFVQKMPVRNTVIATKAKETSKHNKNMVLILLQVFFAAFAILLIRYLYFKSQNPEISNILGIALIALALDALCIKKLKLLSKNVIEGKSDIKNAAPNKTIIRKNNKQKSIEGFKATIIEQAATKEPKHYINPKDFETKVLLEEADFTPYLQGLGENNNEKIVIDKPSFMIGRLKSQSDYISRNNAVGKLHAEIIHRNDTYYIKDLNSRNGTYINGERIVSNVECTIQNNDRISFANSEYKFLRG